MILGNIIYEYKKVVNIVELHEINCPLLHIMIVELHKKGGSDEAKRRDHQTDRRNLSRAWK